MSRRYCLPHIAAVGIVLAGCLGVAEGQPIGNDTKGKSSASKIQDKPQTDKSLLTLDTLQNQIKDFTRALVTAIDKPKSADEEERAKRDLKAQEEMAFWAKLMFFAAGVEACLTGIGVFLVWRTLLHTKRAADAAQDAVSEASAATASAAETAKRQLRAYVFAENVRIHEVKIGHIPKVTIVVKNTGQTPAYDLTGNFGMGFFDFPFVNLPELPTAKELSKIAIGPQASVNHSAALSVPLEKKHIDALHENRGAIAVTGKINYRDAFNGNQYTAVRLRYTKHSFDEGADTMEVCPDGNEAT
jgi:hypothetical protein